MNWNYFIIDGNFKVKKLPTPKRTVKIKDVSELDYILKSEIKTYAKTIDEAKKIYTDYFTDMMYEVDVEKFYEYADRNLNKFFGELNGLKGKYGFIEEMFYWSDNTYWGSDRNIDMWDILYESNQEFCPNKKTLLQMEKLEIIERKKSTEPSDLISYLKSYATVPYLNNIAFENNLTLSGKKADKINQLIDGIEKGLVSHLTVDMYRPNINFERWLNNLQIKYIDEIELALATFDYPKLYIAEVWGEVIFVNDEFPVIKTTVKERHKKYFDLLFKVEAESKVKKKQASNELNELGVNVTITVVKNESNVINDKELVFPKKEIVNPNVYKRINKKPEKKIDQKQIPLIVGIAIVLVLIYFIFL